MHPHSAGSHLVTPVLLGSSVSPQFGLFMKVMREMHFMMSSDVVSLSLGANWSALCACRMARHGFVFMMGLH